jgi:DNA-binding MarR family transcriptional regulator
MENEEKSIGFLNGVIHRSAHRYFEKELTSLNLHRGMIHIMKQLSREDGISQKELSTRVLVDKANVTRILKNLEKKELVNRIPDPADARSNLITLTEKGKALQPQFQAILQKWSEILTQEMDDDEIEMFGYLLAKSIRNIKTYFSQQGEQLDDEA